MTKSEFLSQLAQCLEKLPRADRERALDFYSEWIDDSIEEGLSEEDAVAKVGRPEMVATTVRQQTEKKEERPAPRNRKWRAWEIILIVLGSPIWLSLGIAALSVILALFAAVWSVNITCWAVAVSLGGGSLCGLFLVGIGLLEGQFLNGLCYFGATLLLAGLFIPGLYGCIKGTMLLAKWSARVVRGIFGLFRKGELS